MNNATTSKSHATKCSEWEAVWTTYVRKCARYSELKAAGRYGYQLRMPRKAVDLAWTRLVAWCEANGETVPRL